MKYRIRAGHGHAERVPGRQDAAGTPAASDAHPSQEELRALLNGPLKPPRSREVALHVCECPVCQKAMLELPQPPSRVLGRPVHGVPVKGPGEMEFDARRLTAALRERRGGILILAAEWWMEEYACEVAAIALSRAAGAHQTHAIRGENSRSPSSPVPSEDFVLLLNAPSHNLEDWLRPAPEQTILLLGSVEDWKLAGRQPDFQLESPCPTEALAPFLEETAAELESPDKAARLAALANALLLDGEPADPQTPLPPAFVEVCSAGALEPLSLFCLRGGLWAARHVVTRRPCLLTKLERDLTPGLNHLKTRFRQLQAPV